MRAVAVVLLVGCAKGTDPPPIDALVVDSIVIDSPDAPMLTTLSQTTSPTIEAKASQSCGTAANNYYRVFDLTALGITTDFHVYKVSFGIEASPEVDATVRVGTYADTPGDMLSLAAMTVQSSSTGHIPEVIEIVDPPSTPGAMVDAYFDTNIVAGSKLLVEVDAPKSTTSKILIGANDDGETAPAYVLAPGCNIDQPNNISMQAGQPVNLLITVTGWY